MNVKTRAVALVSAGLVACGTAQGVDDARGGEVVLLTTATGLQAVSAASGAVERQIPSGVADPALSVLVSTRYGGAATTVTRLTPEGKVLSQVTVVGDVSARVVTGDLVALTDRVEPGTTPYLPAPKDKTRVVILDDSTSQREYSLSGNFEPEAFRVDGSELFMIEYIPALSPERYRVRRLRLDSGAIIPIGPLKLATPGQMQGTGRTQVMAPSGDEIYTLYTQQLDAGHGDENHAPEGDNAFVHVLNLRQAWTHCIDLPPVFAAGRATASAIAVNPWGSRLFVADWTYGAVAELNPRRVRVVDTADVAFGPEDETTFAAASNTLLYVAGNSSVVVIDPDTLEVVERWGFDEEITGLSLNSDGRRLYVSTASEVTAVDPATGTRVLSFRSGGATGIAGVVAPAR